MIQDALAKMAIEQAIKDFKNNQIKNPYKLGTGMYLMYDRTIDRISSDLEEINPVEFKSIKGE